MPKGLGKGYNDLSKEDKELIIKDYYNGISVKELIVKHKTTKRAVPKVLKEYDINTKRKNHYILNENYFEIIDTEHKAYWLGFIAADGCITKTNYFAISLKDEDLLLNLKSDLDYTGKIYKTKHQLGDDIYSRINFSSKKMCDDLRKLGIHENKSLTYNELPNISEDLMPHFIRGYFDGDGSIYKDKRRKTDFKFNIIATYDFCISLNLFLKNKIDYDGKIHEHAKTGMYFYNVYDNKAVEKLYYYLYNNATIYLERKYNIWQTFLGTLKE